MLSKTLIMNLNTRVIARPRVRMVLVGALSVATAYTTFVLLLNLGVHYQVASVANFATYWVINFTLNRRWAFQSTGKVHTEAFAHFWLHIGNQVMIMAGLYVLVELFNLSALWSQVIMQILATLTVFLITPWIFGQR